MKTRLPRSIGTVVTKRTTLHGRIICEGAEPSSIREDDIYRILQLKEVTDVEALYKTSKGKFVLIFGSDDSAWKCRSAELSATSGEARVTLLFREWRGAPTFVTLFCPEYISCRTLELAFANFGEVQWVFYGTHTFNRNLKNGKRHGRIFLTRGDFRILPRRITFPDGISRDEDCRLLQERHSPFSWWGLTWSCQQSTKRGSLWTAQFFLWSYSNPHRTYCNWWSSHSDGWTSGGRGGTCSWIPFESKRPWIRDIGFGDSWREWYQRWLTSTLQEKPNNSPPRTASVYQARCSRPIRDLPKPKPRLFQQTLFKSKYSFKRTYYKEVKLEMIEHFGIP